MVNGVRRILVVEDEQGVRKLLRDFFHLRGFQAAEAAGGQEALAQLAASLPYGKSAAEPSSRLWSPWTALLWRY